MGKMKLGRMQFHEVNMVGHSPHPSLPCGRVVPLSVGHAAFAIAIPEHTMYQELLNFACYGKTLPLLVPRSKYRFQKGLIS